MNTCSVKVLNRAGIHARPASVLVQTAQKYECSVWIIKDDVKINAKSILNILTLGAVYDTELTVSADGPDEEEAVREIAGLFANRFRE